MSPRDVHGQHAVVVGGDAEAAGEVATLLAGGATVTVLALDPCASLEDLAERGLVTLERRGPALTDLETADLVLRPRRRDRDERAPGAGRVTLVGGGPGDPGLLTLAGKEALETADLVVTDRLAPLAALAWAPAHAEVVDVAKIPGGRSTEQAEINRLLVEGAKAGRHVVRLKGGDSFVFGRGGEEVVACARAGIDVRVVPGVSSAIAGPAVAGVPVTHRGLTQGFTVVSGHVPPDHPDCTIDYAALASAGTTIVVLMGVRTLGAICRRLVESGLDAATPAVVVADASLPSQRRIRGTVATIDELAVAADVGPPAVSVIGAVADIDDLP